ncbi:DUF4833 domain-containing protein [Prolixibacter sp. NT017]|uniref:DUF4833 domain-containing protein n=1 Tax=Prolixibacter sp. NT017 TaxID=2652390 RepID=UPI00127A534A|nr:DUF4833 domain-containing protein [Prolixibacter sp. NT017]GET24377.1 hypothetical protein NT017_07060 [Prolixibacter sp. NT017]
MKRIIQLTVLLAFMLLFGFSLVAADSGKTNDNTLFKIGRSKDANEIYYEVRTNSDGTLNLEEPIKIYWIKYTKNGDIEPLTKIQQHFAYGLNFLDVTPEKAEFQFVSYAKRTLSLRKNNAGRYGVFTEVDGKEVELERVFIQIDGGTFWFPKITRVEVHAKKVDVGELIVEVIRP